MSGSKILLCCLGQQLQFEAGDYKVFSVAGKMKPQEPADLLQTGKSAVGPEAAILELENSWIWGGRV